MSPTATAYQDTQGTVAPANRRDVDAMAAMAHRGKALPGIPNFDSYAEKRVWQLQHMAGAFRVFAREGYAEGISGHISVRDPELKIGFGLIHWVYTLGC
jgi:hypothetical protein